MTKKHAIAQNITLYPDQVAKLERMMKVLHVRKFSQMIQRIVDDAEEPVRLGVGSAEKTDTREGAVLAGNIGA